MRDICIDYSTIQQSLVDVYNLFLKTILSSRTTNELDFFN